MNANSKKSAAILILLAITMVLSAQAAQASDDLRSAVQNPISSLISLPFRIFSPLADLFEKQPEIMSLGSVDEIPRSTDNMDPTNRFILTIAEIPIAPGIKAHSIIAVDNLEDPEEEWNDGVVAYESAHIQGATSELIVASGHSAQENPIAIEEVRRILREHLRKNE